MFNILTLLVRFLLGALIVTIGLAVWVLGWLLLRLTRKPPRGPL